MSGGDLGLSGRRLVVFMTRGVTLADWRRIGMLERELALYRRLIDAGLAVTLVSDGAGDEEREVARSIAPIEVVGHDPGLGGGWGGWRDRRRWGGVDVIKTNQSDGGDAARRLARRLGKPWVARCGYMLSEFRARRFGEHDRRTRAARRLERRLFREATRVQVTTPAMARGLEARFGGGGSGLADRLRVVPNYVDTDAFCPAAAEEGREGGERQGGRGGREPVDLVFVGRDSVQKNLPALLEAIAGLEVRALLIGTGRRGEPPATAGRVADGPTCEWAGQVAHDQLPAALRRARVFVMPSLYEGHPKALIEAMACGLAVVASDRPGLAEVVEQERTGLLCEPTPAGLRLAIRRLLEDEALRARLGAAAREEAVQRYSLERIVELEAAVLREAIAHG